MEVDLLEEIIRLFVSKERRDRFFSLLSTKHRYDDFLYDLLRDTRYIDPSCIIELPGNEHTADAVHQRLVEMGCEDRCYIVSLEFDMDGRTMDLRSALDQIVGTMSESLIFCPKKRVAYYEGHEGWRYILHRL